MSFASAFFDPIGAAIQMGRDTVAAAHRPPEDVAHGDASRTAPSVAAGPFGGLMRGISDFGRGIAQEGLAGLLDPAGMIDRQEAQRELAERFHVRKDGEAAPKGAAGNNVSEQEFERIAREYSDIRRGKSDLHLDTKGMKPEQAAQFQHNAMGDIADIMQTASGRELIDGLAHQKDHHQTTIHLRTDAKGNVDNTNATGGAEAGAKNGSWADGKGTDAQVTYAPGPSGGIVPPGMTAPWLPMRSDVTLYHELTHAHHAAYGTLDQTVLDAHSKNVNPDDVGQNGMEYQAVGLGAWAGDNLTENHYRDERRAIGASGEGTRSAGGVADKDMPHRNSYVWYAAPPAGTPGAGGKGIPVAPDLTE